MYSVENHEIDPVAVEKQAERKSQERVEDIRSKLLGSNDEYEIDLVIEKENGKAEGDSLSKKRC